MNSLFSRLESYINLFKNEIESINTFESTPSFKDLCVYFEESSYISKPKKTKEMQKVHLFVKGFEKLGFTIEKSNFNFIIYKTIKEKNISLKIISSVDSFNNNNKSNPMKTNFQFLSDDEFFYFEKINDSFYINKNENNLIDDEICKLLFSNFNYISLIINNDSYSLTHVSKELNITGILEINTTLKLFSFVNFFDLDFVFNQKYLNINDTFKDLKDSLDLNYQH